MDTDCRKIWNSSYWKKLIKKANRKSTEPLRKHGKSLQCCCLFFHQLNIPFSSDITDANSSYAILLRSHRGFQTNSNFSCWSQHLNILKNWFVRKQNDMIMLIQLWKATKVQRGNEDIIFRASVKINGSKTNVHVFHSFFIFAKCVSYFLYLATVYLKSVMSTFTASSYINTTCLF